MVPFCVMSSTRPFGVAKAGKLESFMTMNIKGAVVAPGTLGILQEMLGNCLGCPH